MLQLIHGAIEHSGRYDRFARAAVASGHAVYATDHRGCGRRRLRVVPCAAAGRGDPCARRGGAPRAEMRVL